MAVSFLVSTIINSVSYLNYCSPVSCFMRHLCLFSPFSRLLSAQAVSKLPHTFQFGLTSQPLCSITIRTNFRSIHSGAICLLLCLSRLNLTQTFHCSSFLCLSSMIEVSRGPPFSLCTLNKQSHSGRFDWHCSYWIRPSISAVIGLSVSAAVSLSLYSRI